jgi:hypothetical protein
MDFPFYVGVGRGDVSFYRADRTKGDFGLRANETVHFAIDPDVTPGLNISFDGSPFANVRAGGVEFLCCAFLLFCHD